MKSFFLYKKQEAQYAEEIARIQSDADEKVIFLLNFYKKLFDNY